MGPLVSQAQLDKVLGYIAGAKAEGARLVCGGGQGDRAGLFVQPTVFADVTDDMTLACEEVFGPVMAVLDFDARGRGRWRGPMPPNLVWRRGFSPPI